MPQSTKPGPAHPLAVVAIETLRTPVNLPMPDAPLPPPLDSISEMGRTRDLFACPFCSARTWVFAWSLSGSGKLCPCGAKFHRTGVSAPKAPR